MGEAKRTVLRFSEPEVLAAHARECERRMVDVGRGRLPVLMAKPIIYFAGPMMAFQCDDDWRIVVADFCKESGLEQGDVTTDTRIDCQTFWYGGPFMFDGQGGHTGGHTCRPEDHQDIW